MKNVEELVDQCIANEEKNMHYDCFDILLKDILQSESSFDIRVASLLLNVMVQSSEAMALRIISKFMYKEPLIDATKIISGFLLQVRANIMQNASSPLSQLKERLMSVFGLLNHCVMKWKVRDIIVESQFYNGQTMPEFLSQTLPKAFQHFNSSCSQIFAIETLQFLSVMDSNTQNPADYLDFMPDNEPNTALALSLLTLILNQKGKSAEGKVLLKIKQLPETHPRITSDLLLQLSKDVAKHLTSVLFYVYQFDEPFSLLLPSFVQQVTSSKEGKALVEFPKQGEEGEAELYKKLLEIEVGEHRRDVEMFNAGLMQAEGEVQILKEQNLTSAAIAEALKKVLSPKR
eukprot:TRINITY_DN5941_c0_g1_i1.p1 TRINITY_DN5941_c0_g1~~TRINITY_DN5941_c0_g1_i1.p1  ORF type:complete len:346 (+),score=53.17 TRINITY_DN5941_c0_g1_i1:1254-2291(+)